MMKFIDKDRVVGIIRGADTRTVEAAVEAALTGGLATLEITLNRPEACEQIAFLKARYGDDIEIGAGTVLTADAARKAVSAGAEFLVTPALVPDVIASAREHGVPVFPGAMTPTEILAAHRAGAHMVKVFPASTLGPPYIKSLAGPFPAIKLMPTGGVSLELVPAYFQAGAAAVGAGSELFQKELMAKGDWKAIEKLAAGYVAAAREAR